MSAGSNAWWPRPVLIAGPCALETREINLRIAESLAELAHQLGLSVVYKGSFDKANRSAAGAPRGLGLERGLRALEEVRSASGLPILTDIHEAWQAEPVAQVVDALQIPAFLCRQTDLLTAAGITGKPVNVKKGQWMSPEAMRGAVDKVRQAGADATAVTERGTFFGYGDLVVDMRSFRRLREAAGTAVLYDATHAVQQPGTAPGGGTGGSQADIPPLMWAAAAAGADGFFVETHPNPDEAPSDRDSMVPLRSLRGLVERTIDIWTRADADTVIGA